MDQWVRLGMAITIIALVSVAMHRFSGAKAVEPGVAAGITDQR